MANPYLGSPWVSGALAGLQGFQSQKTDNENRALKKAQIDSVIASRNQQESDRQQSIKDRADNMKSLEANRRMSMYLRRQDSGEFDGKSDDEIKAILGFDPNNPMGDGPVSGSVAPSPLSSTPPPSVAQPNAMGQPPGDLGAPGLPVDATPFPPQFSTRQEMPPPGINTQPPMGIPPQAQPQVPLALQNLARMGQGPLAGMPAGPAQGRGMMPPSAGNLTPSDMQSAGATPWQTPQGMTQPAGIPPQPARGPWGAPESPLSPLGGQAGYDPIKQARDRMAQDLAILNAKGVFYAPKTRAAAQSDYDKQQDNLRGLQTGNVQALAKLQDAQDQVSKGLMSEPDFLNLVNQYREATGVDFKPRMRNQNFGASGGDLKALTAQLYDAANAAHDQNPDTWREQPAPNGKGTLGDYLDVNGNLKQTAAVDLPPTTRTGLAKSAAQTALSTARQGMVDRQNEWFDKYKGKMTEAQIAQYKATTRSILEGRLPLEKAQLEYDKIRNKFAPETFQSTIDRNRAGIAKTDVDTLIGQARLNGTLPASGGGGASGEVLNLIGKRDQLQSHIRNAYLKPSKDMFGNPMPSVLKVGEDGELMINPAYIEDKDPAKAAQKQSQAISAINDAADSWNAGRALDPQIKAGLEGLGKKSRAAGGNVSVSQATPAGNRIALMAQSDQSQVCKDPNDRQCQKHLRTSLQKAIPGAYDDVWDRSPTASAMSNLNRFIARKIAKPYTPGMAIPPGSILYSTKLGKAAGKDSGHGSLVGMQGQRYDQHGVNHFPASDYDWYVPPPGGGSAKTASAPPATKARIGRFIIH